MSTMTFGEEDLKGGTYLGEGEYVVTVLEAKEETSAAGNPMIVVKVGDSYGRERREFIPNVEKTRFRVAQFAKACGFTDEQLKDGINVPDAFVGAKLRCLITAKGKRVVNGKEFDKHEAEFFKLDGVDTQPSTFEEDDIPF